MLIHIRIIAPIQRRPLRLILEQAHRLDIILTIGREPVIDAGWQDNQIVLFQSDAHPIVLLGADVEEALAVEDVADLFIFVEMLVEEHLHLLFVDCAHLFGGDGDFVAVLVGAAFGDFVHVGGVFGGDVVVEDAESGEVGGGDGFARVMVETLVALRWVLAGRIVEWGSRRNVQAYCRTSRLSCLRWLDVSVM